MTEWIMGLTQLCAAAVAAGKTLKEWKANQMTDRERELLSAVAEQGNFILSHSDQCGKFVKAGAKTFIDTDPAITAKYIDAFTRLCDRGLIDHQNGNIFRLTGHGFDLARKIRLGE